MQCNVVSNGTDSVNVISFHDEIVSGHRHYLVFGYHYGFGFSSHQSPLAFFDFVLSSRSFKIKKFNNNSIGVFDQMLSHVYSACITKNQITECHCNENETA